MPKTIADVKKVWAEIDATPKDWATYAEALHRSSAINSAIMQDTASEDLVILYELLDSMELGPAATKKLEEFEQWWLQEKSRVCDPQGR
jgi:hypothetical protein